MSYKAGDLHLKKQGIVVLVLQPLSLVSSPLSLVSSPLSLVPSPLSLVPCPLSLVPSPLSLVPCPLSFNLYPLTINPQTASVKSCYNFFEILLVVVNNLVSQSLPPCKYSLNFCPYHHNQAHIQRENHWAPQGLYNRCECPSHRHQA